jgi:solute:Na+ symporter, SSS family
MIIDLTLVLLYLVAITAYGVVTGRKTADTQEGYFLGGRSFGWILIGLSLFATNISITQFMSTSGLAQKVGLASINNDLIGGLMMALSALLFIPIYIRSGLCTMTEFLERRFGRGARLFYAIIFLLLSVLTMPFGVYLGALAALGLFNLSTDHLGLACLLIGGSVGLYSVLGGLTAVVKTDAIQAGLMVAGGLIVLVAAVAKLGGLGALAAGAAPGQFELLQPRGSQMPWTALPGIAIASAFFAFCNVGMLQRALGARDVRQAQLGVLFGAFLKLLSIPLFALTGIAAAQLFPGSPGDQTYALMVREYLPVGVSGLVFAGMLSALMSTADSGVCAVASVLSYDVHPLLAPKASPQARQRFGKWASGVLVVTAFVLAPFGQSIENIYLFGLRVAGFLFLPVGVCFIFGRFVRRVNHAGALATLSVGLVLGLSYVLATLVPGLQPLMPKWLAGLHFYEVLPFFFVLLSTVILSVSLLTAPPASEQLAILDLRTAAGGELGDESLPWWRGFPFWLAVYLGVLAALYVVF